VGVTLTAVPPGFDADAVRRRVTAELDARGEAA
jgi:hypothetical protein